MRVRSAFRFVGLLSVFIAFAVSCSSGEPTAPTFGVVALATPPEGGSVSGGGRYAPGATVSVAATPNPGYLFTAWTTADGTVLSVQPTYSFADSVDRTLVAGFVPQYRVEIAQPRKYEIVGDSIRVFASVFSFYQIVSVRASIGDLQAPMKQLLLPGGQWEGSLNISSVPRDTISLVVTATDALGGTLAATQRIIHDRPPVITVTAPIELAVARPSIGFSATCSDDGPAGCLSLTVAARADGSSAGRSLASGVNSVAGTASVAELEGASFANLVFTARDSRGQTTTVSRRIYVVSSSQVDSLGSAPGAILDVRGGRALYRRPADAVPPLALRTLATGADEVMLTPPTFNPFNPRSFVTPLGAITNGTSTVYEWRSGALTTSTGVSATMVNGNYALLVGGLSLQTTIYRRNLLTGTDELLAQTAPSLTAPTADVASNGDIVYSAADLDVVWYHNGAARRLTNDDDQVRVNDMPLTDGVNVVYREHPAGLSPRNQIVLHDGTTKTLLGAPRMRLQDPNTDVVWHADYEVNNGWTAFTDLDASAVAQVWVRSPTGSLRQASPFASRSVINAIGSDGSVVFTSGGRRYLTPAGGAARDVGDALGTVVWRDGDFLLILGGTVWKIKR